MLVDRLGGRMVLRVMAVLSHTGGNLVWLAAGLGLLLGSRAPEHRTRRLGVRILWIWALTSVLNGLLKAAFRRARPATSLGVRFVSVDQHAFPSGHAMRVGGLSMALASLLPGWAAVGLWAWSGAVCLSRVLLGLHYVGDVLVGWSAGLLTGVALRRIVV